MSEATRGIIKRYISEYEKKRASQLSEAFSSKHEILILTSALKAILESGANVVVYEVANYENLFDYATLFMKAKSANPIPVMRRQVYVIPVTTIPHNVDMAGAVNSVDSSYTPLVAYFVGDLIQPEQGSSSGEIKELVELLSMALFEKRCYVALFTTNPVVLYDNIPPARYGVVLEDVAPAVISETMPEKRGFSDAVGFYKLISMSVEGLAEYTRKRRLPTPHTIKPLERNVTFDEMVLPESIKEFIRLNVINPLRSDFRSIPSLFFIGPSGSGKTSLSYTIAQTVGVPAYLVYVELMTSKWLGESEKIANQTMLLINDRAPVVAVFRDIELIIGGSKNFQSEESAVYERIRSIISSWLRSTRRKFMAVFTVSDPRKVPDYILQDATFGVYKLPILPPLTPSDRRRLLVTFIRKLAGAYGLVFDPTKQSVSEALDTVAEETWAFTPRELSEVSRMAVRIARDRGFREVTKECIQTARKFVDVDRVARVELMMEAVKACKKVGIPEALAVEVYRFETEVEKLKAEVHARESKKKALISMIRE